MIFETVKVGQLQVNCYILAENPGLGAVIIDPGDEKEKIERYLNKYRLKAAMVINTHGHIDHIACDDEFGVPVYAHQDEIALLKDADKNLSTFLISVYTVKSKIAPLNDRGRIYFGAIELEVIHTPGHTPGGICLLMKKPQDNILFSGDTLFSGSVGRTDFAQASHEVLIRSIKEKLLVLNDDTVVYPGHGPKTTIGNERKHNQFL